MSDKQELAEQPDDNFHDLFKNPEAMVYMNYPKLTTITKVVSDVARWSNYCIIVDPQVNEQIQIFCPDRLQVPEAFNLFIASLDTVNLKVINVSGRILKVVPIERSPTRI